MAIIIIDIRRLSIRLFVSICIWIIFGCVHLSNYRYTWFYRNQRYEKELHLKMNEQLRLSQLYWNELLKTPNSSDHLTSDICTVLISSPRNQHPTLHYTLSSLVTAMTPEEKLTMKIIVYNTARPPYLHQYAQELSEAHIPFLQVIDSSLFESELYSKSIEFKRDYQKWIWTEAVDYLFALSYCQERNSSYILILQDDLIFTKQFFTKLRSALNNKFNCSSLRLFKSDFWDGWELEDTPLLFIISAFISTLILWICLIIDNRKCHRSRRCIIETRERIWNVPPCPIYILFTFWLIWILFIVIILVSTNRQNFQFLFGPEIGVYPMKSSVSGALAQVYPWWTKVMLEEFLRKRLKRASVLNRIQPIDVLLNQFFEQQNTSFQQCHLVPDLVDHIGVYSSSPEKNQGQFTSMKRSGTFRLNEAAIDFNFI